MIVKERAAAEHADGGVWGRAGAAAESQMAHYLRRAFGDEPGVAGLNDLRVAVPGTAGDFAQVDHLLIHRFGLIVVESKSVHDTVTINPAGEWARTIRGGGREGMASPILQARRQAEALLRVLAARFDPLGAGLFARVPIGVLVAISDGGIIDRGSADVPEVCKAEAVADRVRAMVAGHVPKGRRFDGAARQRMAEYLVSVHVPLRRASDGTAPAAKAGPVATRAAVEVGSAAGPACRACGSRALHAQHGRYGYFYRCISCTANTPMPRVCPACNASPERVRKEKLNFFVDCGRCRRTTRVYTNASLADLDGPDDER